MKQNIVKAVKFFIYLTFFVPLLVLPTSFIFPFIVPKILAFRSLVELMIAGYILLLFINWQEFRPKFSWLSIAVGAFFVSFTISTFAGVDWYHSFWDNHERMLGLFTIFHYVAYYFICSSLFKTWDDWRKALKVFLVAGSLVMLVGLIQVLNPNLLLNQGSGRVIATLGNAIYVGGYGLFLVFVSFLLFVKENNKIWKLVEVVTALLAFFGMIFSGTRGSLIGLVGGIGLGVISYIIFLKDFPKTRKILGGIVVLGLVLIGLLYNFRESAFVQKIPAVNRAVATSFVELKNSPRWLAWESAVSSWKEKPVFGWGPNNFFYAFNKYYQSDALRFGYGETWFDNAHNILVNTLAVQGVVGLAAYLAIFIAVAVVLIVARRKNALDIHIFVAGGAFLFAHLIQSVTVFENPTSYLYFMFWLAMVTNLSVKKETVGNVDIKNKNQTAALNKPLGSGSLIISGLLVFAVIFIFNIQPARANMKALQALKYLGYQPEVGIELMKSAIAFNSPHIDDIRGDLSRTAAQILSDQSNTKLSKEKRLELFNLAEDALKVNVELHPYDIRNYLSLSQLGQIGYNLTGDTKYIADYGSYLDQALSFSPKRQQIIYNIANFYLQTGRTDESVKLLEKTLKDGPMVGENYWRLAYIYRLTGKMDKAKEVIALADKNGVVFDQSQQDVIKQILTPDPKK
jgi:O-antigen ligase/tetratricopeptide (TPR) repeat protein